MKILFLIHSLSSGGAERVTGLLANYWAAKGWDVTIVTVCSEDKDFYKLDMHIKRIALGLDNSSDSLIAAIVGNVRRLIAVRRILKLNRPDIALGIMTTSNVMLALSSIGISVTVVGAEHIHPPAFPLGRAWGFLRRATYRRLSALVALTNQTASWLKRNAPAPRIKVIPNPVSYPLIPNPPKVSPCSVIRPETNAKMILSVGRLEDQKGFDRLIGIFEPLARKYPNWILVILGEGPRRVALQAQVDNLGISNHVVLPGNVGNIGDWYEVAEIYVLSSRFEGLPMTLLEALAHGLPVVAVDCETGPRDILRDGFDGLLVPQGDAVALQSAVEQLMVDDALRERLRRRAVDVRDRYGLSAIAKSWEDLFRELC